MILTYQPARSGDRLLEDGVAYCAGALVSVSDERGQQLLADPDAQVVEQRSNLTRAQLNRQAQGLGVTDAHKLASKQAVLDAIADAQQGASGDDDASTD